ncbi:MAG: DegT/DnrJ/EryC1/StrS family aminotransferase [Verrucomicrobiales bacterium]|jgi:dTDP-4-amino-4,6-dideoxygalactose transaminase|nr:DegT/DnrJ/EryC1/StrS family aminotransferase [Verrucomicrobiales bacterium]
MNTTTIPYFSLAEQNRALRAELATVIGNVMDCGAFCLGPEVEAFEQEFAAWNGSPHVVAVNSGTSALHLAARLLDLGAGDEVITTPFTFAATSWAISYVGARPVYVDVDPVTCNLDPARLAAAITPRTKAIIPVHLYGHPCAVEAIARLAAARCLGVIEDAAQAHGATVGGRKTGNFAPLAAFSFYPTKNLGALGEGGALVIRSAALARRARALRNHGCHERYRYDEVGYNYRMEGMQGAVLRVKLRHLDEFNRRRRALAGCYTERLRGLPLTLPVELPNCRSAWHLYVIRAAERDALARHLAMYGIGSAIHYPIPLHRQKAYARLGYRAGDFPVAEQAAREVLALPFYPEMPLEHVDRVSAAIRAFYE